MGLFGFSSNSGTASATAGFRPQPYVVGPSAARVAAAPQNQIPVGPPRIPVNQNPSNPPTKAPTPPVTNDDHLYHTGVQPLDAGLNFMSGIGGAEWQTAKGLGSLLYNNNPIGAAVGVADATGMVRNIPTYVPDAWRTEKPFMELGHALATHPGQVLQGAKQAGGNWWDSLSQGDPDKRAYAWGGTAFNGLMAADGAAGVAGLAGKVGSLARSGEFLSTLGASGGEALAPAAAESGNAGRGAYFFDQQVLPNIDRPDATLGLAGQAHFFMPAEDSALVSNAADAYRYTGGAPSLERAYVDGGNVYGVDFPLDGLSPRLPTASDTTLEHFLEGGNTALKLPNSGGYLVNPTREFVMPGGRPMPSGSVMFRIGSDGRRIPIRTW